MPMNLSPSPSCLAWLLFPLQLPLRQRLTKHKSPIKQKKPFQHRHTQQRLCLLPAVLQPLQAPLLTDSIPLPKKLRRRIGPAKVPPIARSSPPWSWSLLSCSGQKRFPSSSEEPFRAHRSTFTDIWQENTMQEVLPKSRKHGHLGPNVGWGFPLETACWS